MAQVNLNGSSDAEVAEEDSWILEANSIHLAANYNPEALHMILSKLTNMTNSIEFTHANGKMSPLHLAASKPDSKSTR